VNFLNKGQHAATRVENGGREMAERQGSAGKDDLREIVCRRTDE